jgi:large subunit ribosomal protein L4
MELAIIDKKGKATGKKISFAPEVFEIEPNDHAIYLDTKLFLANQRQGTHKSKERAEVAGSTRKIKKQKGTGTARAGAITSPVFRGGGRVFGPRPRSYTFSLNKKVKDLANKSALTYKLKEDNIQVLSSFELKTPKTKEFIEVLANLGLGSKKVLVVTPENDNSVYLSGRNLKKVQIISATDVNTYSVLKADKIVFVDGAVEKLTERLK